MRRRAVHAPARRDDRKNRSRQQHDDHGFNDAKTAWNVADHARDYGKREYAEEREKTDARIAPLAAAVGG